MRFQTKTDQCGRGLTLHLLNLVAIENDRRASFLNKREASKHSSKKAENDGGEKNKRGGGGGGGGKYIENQHLKEN